jgi:butyrate kinase/acetolactate synthase small subunit
MNSSKSERVELLVKNIPGVLGRVAAHIRLEGWNIKCLFVDAFSEHSQVREDNLMVISPMDFTPIEPFSLSLMIIEIEGVHTKLAQVAERLLRLDCVVAVGTIQNNEKQLRRREQKQQPSIAKKELKPKIVPPKPENAFRILTINPGSTSTKFAVYDNETPVFTRTVKHKDEELRQFDSILKQKTFRKDCILKELEEADISTATLDAVSGRGGLLKPIDSGTYLVNENMLADLQTATAAIHASALGAIIAAELVEPLSIPAYVVDPIVVDEMDRNAKLTGMPGIERSSVFHALNQKAIARRVAEKIGKPYENTRIVVAHLGGGITIGAHRYGRVIDVNDALSGEGPFTPERSGGVPAVEIGAMVAVLEGRVDAIALTGGLAHSNRFTGAVKQRVDRLAPLFVFPGENEMLALMGGALRVLRGQEAVAVY